MKSFKQKDLNQFEIDDYKCIIMQQPQGHLSGYIDVPEGHPINEFSNYEDFWDVGIKVHGGITYMENHLIDPDNGEREGNWIGFDCAHAGDLIPAYDDMPTGIKDTFKDEDYVRDELESLVEQLKHFQSNTT